MPAPRSRLGLGSLLIAVLIVLALGVGTVYAAIPNGDGKYYACRVTNTGSVRLINYPKVKNCQAGEKLISWNAKGPAGPAGAQGAQGPQGPAGPADWNAIPNKPAGFADGVDNEGVTSVRVLTITSTTPVNIANNDQGFDEVDCPAGFLAVGGGHVASGFIDMIVWQSRAVDADTWRVSGYNAPNFAGDTTLAAQVHCIRAEPAGIVTAAKSSEYGPKDLKRGKPYRR